MGTGPDSPEDVRRLRSLARDVRDPSRLTARTEWRLAADLLTTLRRDLPHTASDRTPHNPRVGNRPTGRVSYHRVTIHGRSFFFEQIQHLIVAALEEHRAPKERSRDALALAAALRFTCPACSTSIPNAYHHGRCAHLPTRELLAATPALAQLWKEMEPYALDRASP